jgi:hypothetical protein
MVHFLPEGTVLANSAHAVISAAQLAASWPELSVEIHHEQDSQSAKQSGMQQWPM